MSNTPVDGVSVWTSSDGDVVYKPNLTHWGCDKIAKFRHSYCNVEQGRSHATPLKNNWTRIRWYEWISSMVSNCSEPFLLADWKPPMNNVNVNIRNMYCKNNVSLLRHMWGTCIHFKTLSLILVLLLDDLLPGPLFTKRTDVLPQDRVKSRRHEIQV